MRNKVLVLLVLLPVALMFHAGMTAGWLSTPIAHSSRPLALTAGGATLLVVNPDSNTLTVVDTASRIAIAEIRVGTDPRTVAVDGAGRRAYVANRGSGTVSVVALETGTVLAHVPVGARPYGVLLSPDASVLYVAVQGAGRVVTLDTATLEIGASLPAGDRPSGLALSADGRTLFVTDLLSNRITLLSPQGFVLYLPLILKGVPATLRSAPSMVASVAHPLTLLGVRSTTTLFPDSNLVQSVVLSPDGAVAYVPHTRSNTSNPALTFDTTVAPLVSLVDANTGQHLLGQQIDLGILDPPGVGLPFDADVTSDGAELWVVNAASNDLSVLDLTNRRLAAHIEVGANPRGIVLSPDSATAYVNNTLAGTVSVIDTAAYTVTDVITVTNIPLPPILLNGKRLFYTSDDSRMALNQWISCNTCHFEGEHDGRTWTFGFAGPRNTTSLLGMIETYPLRWSGEWDESADSEFANRKENFGSGLVEGDLHCALSPPDCVHQPPNQGRTYDLDSLALFLDGLALPLSPQHAHGEPLTAAELRGQALFFDPALGCASCHPAPLYTDLLSHDVGTVTPNERIGPAFDTPTLRGLWDSAPYFHDGSAATLLAALTRPTPGSEHDVSAVLTEAQIEDLIAYLLALPFTE